MSKTAKCIMLIDDNADDNFFHGRVIKKNNLTNVIVVKTSGTEALEYLKAETKPYCDLIFLDINMPGMNGWEFLREYNLLDKKLQSRGIIIMLTTSDNPDDMEKAKKWNFISEYITKPLTKAILEGVIKKYFK